ncbi:MAG: metal-dependent hydrolase [Xanthomonadales bacterium]|nr:metal-dependent hydrolase [Xanthomonadales bacterium]
MFSKSHSWAGLVSAATVSAVFVTDPATTLLGLGFGLLAASVPDSIQPNLPFIHWRGFDGHRGVSHWLLVAVVSTWLWSTVWPGMWQYWLWGYLSHLFLDLLTVQGIPFWGPWPKRVNVANFVSGGWFDKLLERLLPVVFGLLLLVWGFQWWIVGQ